MGGEITIDGENAVFTLTGVDRVLALKSRLVVPLKHITEVSTDTAKWNYLSMIKIGGARIPGVVVDGRFLGKDGLLFYEMHDPSKCISVSLKEEAYKTIVFEVDDKEMMAKNLKASISKSRT